MPWAVAGGAVAAGGSLLGGMMQSGAVNKAAAQKQRNLELMLPQIQGNYVQAQNQLAPYLTEGTQGLTATSDLLGLNGPDAATAAMQRYQTSPGYEWQMEQGLRGVDAGAAARGMLRSGATLKAEDTFAQGLANSDFGQYYNRLFGLSQQGQNAVGASINAGTNMIAQMQGNATSQNANLTDTANAQSSIYGNTASSLGTTLGGLLQNKDVQGTLKGLFSSTPFDYSAGTTNTFGTSPGFSNQLFNSGGVF